MVTKPAYHLPNPWIELEDRVPDVVHIRADSGHHDRDSLQSCEGSELGGNSVCRRNISQVTSREMPVGPKPMLACLKHKFDQIRDGLV